MARLPSAVRPAWPTLLACLLSAFPAAAGAAGQETAPWIGQADRLDLAADPEWLALGHYAPRPLGRGVASYADDPDFFLSPAGARDPGAELAATLTALLAEPDTQCRFPARRNWLVERLPGLDAALPAADCPEYREWRGIIAADRVVLVFAASYLNSPSSMYGHTFLRFDKPGVEAESPWLSYALNFGAVVSPDDNDLLYIWRGLAGGYPGRFAAGPYFEKLREYSRLENRDLWEYRLNLTPAEVDRLLDHVWELRDIDFDYYFFDENCSFRLLELLDVARPGLDLATLFPHYAIPVDTVRAVADAGLVAGVDYRPANLTLLSHQIAGLSPDERDWALALSEDPARQADPGFQALPPERRRLVADAAYGHRRLVTARKPRDPESVAASLSLLALVNRLPAPAEPSVPARPVAPDQGHRTGLLAVGVGVEDGLAFGDAEWRLSYHDLLDHRDGYPDNASLNMGRFVVRAREGGDFQLQRADIIEITSLAPRDEFLRPLSWRVNFGWERQWTEGEDRLVTQVNGGAGFTWTVAPGLDVSLLGTGRLEYNDGKSGELDLAPGAALLVSLGTGLGRTELGVQGHHFLDGTERTHLSLAHNLPLGRNLALRFGYDRRHSGEDRIQEAGLALRFYY